VTSDLSVSSALVFRGDALYRSFSGISGLQRLYTSMENHPIVQHIPRLRRYARALIGDRYSADDLVQDTLERAWNKLHLWRPGSDMRAWLFAIMHNVFVNHARSRRYEVESNMEILPTLPVRATQGDHLELLDVERALRTLPVEQREVLLLVAVEEMTYEEVSKALDVPIGTVMSRLSRGRDRLRQVSSGSAVQSLKVVK
jgi:RNA polymerase sigma-70 factor (ECF subfamily)